MRFYIYLPDIMPQRNTWTQEDDRSIKFLKQEKKIESWEEISQILNENSRGLIKSAKDCKSRYLSHSRFLGEDQESKQVNLWTFQQDRLLLHFYLQEGCKWNYIAYHFPSRSETCIKNRFYSSLRKAAREMSEVERKFMKRQKNSVTYYMLMNVFDIVNSVQKGFPEIYAQLDSTVQLTELRDQILVYVFEERKSSQEQILTMVKRIRKLNSKIRSFGIFKIKNRKNWKLSEPGLKHLLTFCQKPDQQLVKLQTQ